jgi:hypothetical protein
VDEILRILQSWWASAIAWISSEYTDWSHRLVDAIVRRVTGPPLIKVVLLIVSLWIALRVIGWVNGIASTGRWDAARVSENGGLHTGKVRLPRDQEKPRPWWKRIFGLGRPKLLLKKSCIFTIPIGGPVQAGQVFVEPIFANLIAKELLGRDLDDSHDVPKILAEHQFDVIAKRANSLKYVLFHPDTTLRTTAWVVVITESFEILRAFIFEG